MKTIVVYYSRKGSNKYLAERIAERLSCDIEAIRPQINSFPLFLMKFNPGIRPLKHPPGEYDRVILVGPVWTGQFIPPLKGFVKKYLPQIKKLVFVTCCGSTYDKKDEKFGHGLVFREVEKMVDGRLILTKAFPIGLVMPEGHQEDPDAFMKAHLNDDNFRGEILERFGEFIKQLN